MIVEHPTKRFITDKWPFEGRCMVQCDFCKTLASHVGDSIEEAVPQAYKSGFKLVSGAKRSDPKKWACKHCPRPVSPPAPSEEDTSGLGSL